jgi:hypothetical protein
VRRKAAEAVSWWPWAALAVFAAAAALRLWGLTYGLPHTHNADEPHLVHMAVSFGGGSLKPYSFKYPTLWPTMLAGLYGLYFAVWSVLGLRRGVTDFAALYGFEPTGFYLIARALAAAASLGALAVLARAERAQDRSRWPWAALTLAFSPVLVELAHSAKPDSLMLLFVSGAWACALRFQAGGARGWLDAAGALCGAACSTQYTAAPAALMLPLAWALRAGGRPYLGWLLRPLLLAAFAFAAGSPYAVIDWRRFLADWSDYADLGRLRPHDPVETARAVGLNLWTFGGPGSPAGAAAALGLGLLAWRDARRALLLAVPVAAYFAILSQSPDGTWQRYLLGAFPALALLAGEGLAALGGAGAARRAATALLLIAPGALASWDFSRELSLPDTRAAAAAWIEAEVPAEDAILLDAPHASPRVIPSREQCGLLAERTAAAGSPRARLWRAMAERHPGGGRRVYRLQRSAADLFSAPRHVAASQADAETIDARPGLDTVRAKRVGWVVTSSFGADPRRARELATFFSELAAGADLVREFAPVPGETTGPWLRVWRLRK